MRGCAFPNCNETHEARRYCKKHHALFLKSGSNPYWIEERLEKERAIERIMAREQYLLSVEKAQRGLNKSLYKGNIADVKHWRSELEQLLDQAELLLT